jgi:hypothetical protein
MQVFISDHSNIAEIMSLINGLVVMTVCIRHTSLSTVRHVHCKGGTYVHKNRVKIANPPFELLQQSLLSLRSTVGRWTLSAKLHAIAFTNLRR